MTVKIVPWAWRIIAKPHIGALHVRRAWWNPNRTLDAWFEPCWSRLPQGHTPPAWDRYPVPAEAVDAIAAATTFEEVMALVRTPADA